MSSAEVVRLGPDQIGLMHELLSLFGDVFEDEATYRANRPSDAYLAQLLASDTFFALVAVVDGRVAGGLAAYELRKFEQARSEIYIYDLAVSVRHRRRGLATALIGWLRETAASRGVWAIFVQADHGDEPAIALYSRLGVREDVLHFDINPVPPPG
jgi:aminoglycoside 3-N-acetyltransferase I